MEPKKETLKTYIKGIEVACNATIVDGKVIDIEISSIDLKNGTIASFG